jgi:hypothetical protein
MATDDDDVAASLPRPPSPRPARREAAIAMALERFDGGGAAATVPPATATARRWPRVGRPYAGALVGALLVALVALPLAWTSLPDHGRDGRPERPLPVASREPAVDEARPAAQPSVAALSPAIHPHASRPSAATATATATASTRAEPADHAVPAQVAAAASKPIAPPASAEPAADEAAASERGELVVTGARIRRPNLTSVSPVTTIGGEEIAGSPRARAGPAARGEWEACTIEDPRRDLAACRARVDPAAKGAPGRAAAQVADGLARAWAGDLDQAMAAFDRAVEVAPRSAVAYLNRGLAWRRRGDLDRALADLNRAVRYAPDSASGYFYRSLVHRARGEERRARADEARAAELERR